MSLNFDSRRIVDVKHRVTVALTDDDRFDATHNGYGANRGAQMVVDRILWPASTWREPDAPTEASRLRLNGWLYRKDGSVGQRKGEATLAVADLPERLREPVLAELVRIYRPLAEDA